MHRKLIALWDSHLAKIADILDRIHIVWLTLGFGAVVYGTYHLLGEHELVETPIRFIYITLVTMSTVGYGDWSPQTEAGQLFTALFVIPFGISLFAIVAAKAAAKAASVWYRKMKGMHTTNRTGHIVIIGYNADRTPMLVEQIAREEDRDIVLVSKEQTENPLPSHVDFINVPSLTNENHMQRAAIETASCIIVDTDTDDSTLTIALFVNTLNDEAHLVAHFDEDVKGRILKRTCPNSECISNLSTELLAKSVIDSGSSLVHSELVSAHMGQTQYSIQVPAHCQPFKCSEVFLTFKEQSEATIIGLRRANTDSVELNVRLDTLINPTDTLFYISDERISFDQWPCKSAGAS